VDVVVDCDRKGKSGKACLRLVTLQCGFKASGPGTASPEDCFLTDIAQHGKTATRFRALCCVIVTRFVGRHRGVCVCVCVVALFSLRAVFGENGWEKANS
jgi:hypothetical protein